MTFPQEQTQPFSQQYNHYLFYLLILDLKIIGQTKRIPESDSRKKETVDIDILVTPRNGDRTFMQSIRILSRPPLRIR